MKTEAQKRAQAKYLKKIRESGEWAAKNRYFQVQCSVENDADVIQYLEQQQNKSGLIKQLIRKHMKSQ